MHAGQCAGISQALAAEIVGGSMWRESGVVVAVVGNAEVGIVNREAVLA